jgi:phosphatidylserine/phosphatidylglycerophosphate/cardiolipin synthase-like enzyme
MTVSSSTRPDILQYCFSPGGDCGSVIIHWISRANSSIHILIYSFTLDDVREALIQAKNRGVDVKVVMERSTVNSSGSEYQNLKNAGLDVHLDTNSGDMHDKVAIVDSHIIITGSMNWTNAGENQNNENLIVIDSQSWAQAYEAQFERVYNASAP